MVGEFGHWLACFEAKIETGTEYTGYNRYKHAQRKFIFGLCLPYHVDRSPPLLLVFFHHTGFAANDDADDTDNQTG